MSVWTAASGRELAMVRSRCYPILRGMDAALCMVELLHRQRRDVYDRDQLVQPMSLMRSPRPGSGS